MRVAFADNKLKRLYTDPEYRPARYGPELVRAYRKKVTLLRAASDERELRAHKSLRLEKLRGDLAGRHSVRLNQQWRLIIKFEADVDGKLVLIVEIIDYH